MHLLMLLALAAFANEVETVYGLASGGGGAEVVRGELIVRFEDGANRAAAAAAIGASLGDTLPSGRQILKLAPGMSSAAGMQALSGVPGVAKIEYNKLYRPNLVPNDPAAGSQYALSQINAFEAWDYSTGDNTVTIAVIDAGIHNTHPEFAGRIISQRVCTGACVADAVAFACNHGTRVAGVAAAEGNNSDRVAGMNWGARIASVRIFSDTACTDECADEIGLCSTSDAAIERAIDDVRTNGALTAERVINISVGSVTQVPCDSGVQTAINNAVAAGIPVVISAGNSTTFVSSPGNCANVIPVGATDASGGVASYSGRGPELDARGVVAPGSAVLTTDINQSTASATGTSFAAPYVAGLASLILTRQPAFTPQQVYDTLRQSANNIGLSAFTPQSQKAGAGRINAFLAMQLAVTGRLADFEGEDKVVAFPNPFRPSRNSNVFFAVAPNLQADNSTLKIYSVAGQLIRELAGLSWDGRNTDGRPVATGTYLYVLANDKGVHRGRLAVIR